MTRLIRARAELATNPRQWEAVTARGHVMVIAPPGSGKTKLLTVRLAQDLVTAIPPPHGAACITYSTAAAGELHRRWTDLGAERRSNLFVGTVHGFALRAIIGPYASLVGRSDVVEATVATAAQRRQALEEAVYRTYGPHENPNYLDSTLARYRRQLDLTEDDDWQYGGERVRSLNAAYSDLLSGANLIDFDDMVRIAVELVEGYGWIRRVLGARFFKLFIDEYQDLGPGLHRLVKALCFDQESPSELFAVADPDQCIYMFSGATPENVDEIGGRHDVTTIRLGLNYRCGSEIIRQSLTAVDGPREVEGRPGGEVVAHRVNGEVAGQARSALDVITGRHNAGTPYGEIAVLCLSNADCLEVAAILRSAEIPTYVRSNTEYPRTDVTMLVEGLAAWSSQPRGTAPIPLNELLREYHRILRRRLERSDDAALVRVLLEHQAPDGSAGDFVTAVAASGISAALDIRQDLEEERDAFARMLHDVTTGDLRQLTLAELAFRAAARDQVNVLTMHGAKGLEFDVVLLVGLEKRRLPRWNATEMETVQARKQFYVALTRARQQVHLYYTGWHRDRYQRVHRDGPSRFVRDLDMELPPVRM